MPEQPLTSHDDPDGEFAPIGDELFFLSAGFPYEAKEATALKRMLETIEIWAARSR
ncbi:hypothetical protein [Mesorhizobium sp.]|uniref:hypothetical protein n=1 Tax=Mesorhizobium sp. TaxID=1871066 RepID=UPI0025796784|nr:hypothetical protein [Mesorhizobium sp.]